MNPRSRSEELHRRVREFAQQTDAGAPAPESFEQLAVDVARFQAETRARSVLPESFEELRPLPVDAFRVASVFCFPTEQASLCFRTSGTTGAATGRHYLRSAQTYEELSALSGRKALINPELPAPWVVALMPKLGPTPASSLGFMARHFMGKFGGHSYDRVADGEPEAWLLSGNGVDVPGLLANVQRATELGRPVLLLATSFALVMLLDELRGRSVHLPAGSVVMQTGGFKGKTRTVAAAELDERLVHALGEHPIVSEYGMTELGSQLYDGALGCGLCGERELYVAPPWLRVVVLDPETLTAVPEGAVGLAAFIDLANVDSAVYVVTQDLVRKDQGGIRLLGRRPRAPLRGCSLAAEALWSEASGALATVASDVARQGRSVIGATTQRRRAPLERVRRLLSAARRIADPDDSLGRRARERLGGVTGLSSQAIELGLRLSLETDPSDDELDLLCASMPPAPRVWTLLSANVFVAAHRAVACALAASDHVVVRPSRRDPVLAELLHEASDGLFELADVLAPEPGDHVHAYGSDETLVELRSALPSGVILLAHGSGIGAGLVLTPGLERQAAKGFALDAVLFEQRGCLSPRVIGVDSACDVESFCRELQLELSAWSERCPAPAPSSDERADQAWYRCCADGVASALWSRWEATAGGVSAGSVVWMHQPEALLVPPPGRNLLVFTRDRPWEQLAELGDVLTNLGVAAPDDGRELFERAGRQLEHVRRSLPGRMQCPPFDGPVDVRRRERA